MPDNKLLGALSLCRKAGALTAGFDAVRDTIKAGKAEIVLFARDLSPSTRKRVMAACGENCNAHDIILTQFEISDITHKPAGVLAVTDMHLAALCLQAIQGQQPHKEEPV